MDLLKAIRPLNGILLAIAVWVAGAFIGVELFPGYSTLVGMLAIFLVSSGGYAIENYLESKKEKRTLAYSIILLAAGITTSFLLGIPAFVVAVIIAALMIAYAAGIKKTMIISNIVISLTVALAFIFGGAIYLVYLQMLPLALLIFLSLTGLEVYRSIDDAVSDQKYNEHSVAMKLGVLHTRLLGNIFLTATVLFSFLPYFLGFGKTYLFFTIIADVLFIIACIAPARYGSKVTVAGILFVIIAFLSAGV